MCDGASVRTPRLRELVFALGTVWLLMQNALLFLWIAWEPLTGLRIAALALVRVAVRAASPVTVLPGAGLLDVARLLIAAGMGVHHV